jgi:hypothetical protein
LVRLLKNSEEALDGRIEIGKLQPSLNDSGKQNTQTGAETNLKKVTRRG